MTEFIRPVIKADDIATNLARFTLEPLERGYGQTLGNSMRRILLSSLDGAAISAVKFAGVDHEFSTIEGVLEDVPDIILNLKALIFAANTDDVDEAMVTLDVAGPADVKASDLQVPAEFTLANPEAHIATLAKGAKFSFEARVSVGRGYVLSEDNQGENDEIGLIATDSLFSPIRRVTMDVQNTRVGQRTDFDKLVLEVETNGAIDPTTAVARAANIAIQHLSTFASLASANASEDNSIFREVPGDNELDSRNIETIDLSVRSFNGLKGADIHTLGDLLKLSKADLMGIRNFGEKSVNEVINKLTELGYVIK